MKKIMILVVAVVSMLGLSACNNNTQPEVISKTCTGEITEIDFEEEILTVLDEKTNEEISFIISLLMPHSKDDAKPFVETLLVGDRVTVETEYAVDCESPYPAVKVSSPIE